MMMDMGGPGMESQVDNISANGVLCHTAKPIPLMTRLRIALDLPKPQEQRIDGEGVVVRCDPDSRDHKFQVAILFTRLADEHQAALRHFVEDDLSQRRMVQEH